MTKSKYVKNTRANLLRELIGASQEDIAGKARVSDGTVGKHLRGKVSAQNTKEAITDAFIVQIDEFMYTDEGHENPLPEELRSKPALMDWLFDRVTHTAREALNRDLAWLRPAGQE